MSFEGMKKADGMRAVARAIVDEWDTAAAHPAVAHRGSAAGDPPVIALARYVVGLPEVDEDLAAAAVRQQRVICGEPIGQAYRAFAAPYMVERGDCERLADFAVKAIAGTGPLGADRDAGNVSTAPGPDDRVLLRLECEEDKETGDVRIVNRAAISTPPDPLTPDDRGVVDRVRTAAKGATPGPRTIRNERDITDEYDSFLMPYDLHIGDILEEDDLVWLQLDPNDVIAVTDYVARLEKRLAEAEGERDKSRKAFKAALELHKRQADRYAYCPDCRDKVDSSKCPRCTIQSLESRLASAEAERDKLAKFKAWVHNYLDTHGVPHHPPGTHGAAGCRIGDRMDWLMAELASARAAGPVPEDVRQAAKAIIDWNYKAANQMAVEAYGHAETKIADYVLSLSPPEAGRG